MTNQATKTPTATKKTNAKKAATPPPRLLPPNEKDLNHDKENRYEKKHKKIADDFELEVDG